MDVLSGVDHLYAAELSVNIPEARLNIFHMW